MNAELFRTIALSFATVEERSHMGHPDFRRNGRIFATLSTDLLYGMAKLTPDQQSGFTSIAPEAFFPASGAWGRGGATMIRLDVVDDGLVCDALAAAYQNIAYKKPK